MELYKQDIDRIASGWKRHGHNENIFLKKETSYIGMMQLEGGGVTEHIGGLRSLNRRKYGVGARRFSRSLVSGV